MLKMLTNLEVAFLCRDILIYKSVYIRDMQAHTMHMLSHTYNPSTCAAYSNCYFPNENNITQMKTENICNMLSSSLYSFFFYTVYQKLMLLNTSDAAIPFNSTFIT